MLIKSEIIFFLICDDTLGLRLCGFFSFSVLGNASSTLQTQILTINHDGNTHQIEVPVSSLVKGQFIDVSEMGLVIANQPLNSVPSTKKGDESLDLSTLQYLRIVSTNEGQNTVALQPVIIPQNWNSALETSNASQNQTAKLDIRNQE